MLQHTNIRGGKYFGSPVVRPDDLGFRLPGHVLTTKNFGPGSEVWREKDMDGNKGL